ncbi:MAG: cobalamin biosynthesis protein CobW [Pseudomonadota bacterium]
MTTKIPATIITGFLGSGKTTLIQNLIRSANGRRIALIVNEFGDLGFDGEQIAGCGIEGCADDDVVELTNGCICCTVADDFLPTMEMLLARKPAPDHIVIETSGLALPQPLVQAFNWPSVATQTTVDGVITVADSEALAEGLYVADVAKVDEQRQADESLDHETPIDELFADQVRCADLIVLSKTEGLSDEALAKADEIVSGRREGVETIRSTQNGLPAALLLGLEAASEEDFRADGEGSRAAAHHHHEDKGHDHDHHHDEFASTVLTPQPFATREALDAYVASLCAKPGVLRVKGATSIEGKAAPIIVQAVGQRISSHFDASGRPQKQGLVVIGLAPLPDLEIADQANAA